MAVNIWSGFEIGNKKIMNRNIVNKKTFFVLLIFTILYPITPSYFRLYGIIFQLIELFATAGLLLFFNKGKYPIITRNKFRKLIIVTFLWAIVLAGISLIYRNTYGVIIYLVPWIIISPFYIKGICNKIRFLKIIDAIIFVSFIVAILGIFEEVTGVNVFSYLNTDGYEYLYGIRLGFNRIFSFTSHPITYSLYCMFIEVLIFYRMMLPETKIPKYIFAYIIVFISAVCTISRSSIILIVLSQILLLWLCGYHIFIKRMMEILCVLVVGVIIISSIFPAFGDMINQVTILVLAVFSDSFATKLAGLGYQWDPSGVADRLDLWKIIFDKMWGHYLLGHGPGAMLTDTYVYNSLGNKIEKTSIEVQPLLVLYRYGILAAFFEELRNIFQIITGYKYRNIKASWEGKIGFNKVCLVLFVFYFFALFTVNQTDTIRIYMLISCLFISYNIFGKFEQE